MPSACNEEGHAISMQRGGPCHQHAMRRAMPSACNEEGHAISMQ